MGVLGAKPAEGRKIIQIRNLQLKNVITLQKFKEIFSKYLENRHIPLGAIPSRKTNFPALFSSRKKNY